MMFIDNLCREVYHGSNMDFQVLSRKLAETVSHDVPYMVISLSNPEWSVPKLAQSPNLIAALFLRFNDRTEPTPGEKLITDNDARAICDFVDTYIHEVKLIIVHCEMGQCRSAAVAAALSDELNADSKFFFTHYKPNTLVYSKLKDAIHSEKQ